MMYLMAVFALGELCGMPELVFGIRIAFLAAFLLLLFADVFLRRSEKKDFKSGRSVIFPLFLFLAGIVISLNSHYAFRSDEKLFGEIAAERASVIAEGEIEGIEDKGKYRLIVLKDAKLRGTSEEGETEASEEKLRKKLYIYDYYPEKEVEELCCGMRIAAEGKLKSPERNSNPGEFDYRLYLRSLNVSLSLSAKKIYVTGGSPIPYREFLRKLKLKCKEILDETMDERDSGIYKALILGDRSDMEDELVKLYQTQGIAHILAVSGLHISLIGMLFYELMLKAGAGLGTAGAVSAFFVLSYGLLTGASGSAMRAAIMLSSRFAAAKSGRSYDNLSALSLSGILLLFSAPYMLLQSGFQLSFAAVFGISFFGEYVTDCIESHMRESFVSENRETFQGSLSELKRKAFIKCRLSPITGTLCTGVLIQIFTLPVLLYHFFSFPLYAFFLNLIVIPLMIYVMYSGLAALGIGAVLTEAAVFFVGPGHYLLSFYELLCRISASLPLNSLPMGRPEPLKILIYYALIFSLPMLLTSKLRLFRGERLIKDSRLMAVILFFSFLLSGLIFVKEGPSRLEITAIDVGQGDGFLIRYRGNSILIDSGSSSEKNLGEYVLEPFLLSQGINKLDCVIVSHGDEDHINGIEYLLDDPQSVKIENLLLPVAAREGEAYSDLKNNFSGEDKKAEYLREGSIILISEEIRLSCIYEGNSSSEDTNAHSPFLLLEYGDFSMLFTGDAPKEEEMRVVKLMRESGTDKKKITVLKAGHHGSKTGSCDKFLNMFDPDYAILSYGKDNSYGHPSREVTTRLKERGIKMLCTAEEGAIRISTDGRRIWISGFY